MLELASFHVSFQSGERAVPMIRNLLKLLLCTFESSAFQFPELFAAVASAAGQSGRGEHVQMLGDRLARDTRALRKAGDGERPAAGKPLEKQQTCLIA